jgi:DNA-binding transcriptional ArsR family regulator
MSRKNPNVMQLTSVSGILLGLSISLLLMVPEAPAESTISIRVGNIDYDKVQLEFEGGGGKDPSLSIPIPDSGPVIDASLFISTIEGKEGPSTVSIDIGMDGHREWSFGGGFEGSLGNQDTFFSGSRINREMMSGSSVTVSMVIPEDAEILNSTLGIYTPPSPGLTDITRLRDILPKNVGIESMDSGDIDGDGIDELVYHHIPDSAIYAIQFDGKGNHTTTTILEGISGDPIIRFMDGNESIESGIIVQYHKGSDPGDRISILTGSETKNLEERVIAENVSRSSPGYYVVNDDGSGNDRIHVIYGNGNGLSEFSLGSSGAIIEQVILDSTEGFSGIGVSDLGQQGGKFNILFPEDEKKNITLLAPNIANDDGEGIQIFDLGESLSILGHGTSIDLDGDGKEEFYFPSAPYGDLAVIGLRSEGPYLEWIGLNGTYHSPRSLSRAYYGDGGPYIGPEGFLYSASGSGFHQIMFDNENGYLSIKAEDIPGNSLVGDPDGSGSCNIYSISNLDGMAVAGMEWKSLDRLSLSSSQGRMDCDLDSRHIRVDISDILDGEMEGRIIESDFGNNLKLLDLDIQSDPGWISLSELRIEYEVSFDVSRSDYFMDAVERARTDFDSSVIPFMVEAGSAGSLEVGPVTVTYDSPPIFLDSLPRNLTIKEGSTGQTLFDVRDHVTDDLLEIKELTLEIVPVSDIPGGILFLDDNHLLVSHASKYPDLNGEIEFRIAVSDMNSRIESGIIGLNILPVQDPPLLVNGLGTIHLTEGETKEILLEGQGGVFTDPDGDPLTFETGILYTDPIDLMDTLSLSVQDSILSITPSINGIGGTARIEVKALDPNTPSNKGTRSVGELKIANVNANPVIMKNPGLVTLTEDQSSPRRIPLQDWIFDPDSDLSGLDMVVVSSDRRLNAYISNYGSNRYLFLQPTEDMTGDATVYLDIITSRGIITDKLRVRIEPVNDLPSIAMRDVDYIEGQGWMVTGIVEDPDDTGGKIEYRIGDGSWRDGWGFGSWSILVDESSVPGSGQYVFIRAHDGKGYSEVEFTKINWPYKPPTIEGDGDMDPGDDDDDTNNPIPSDTLTPDDPGNSSPPWLLLGGIGGVAAGAILFLFWSEVGTVTLITAGMNLYSKLSKKDILNHEIRGLIRGYIIANPGDHYSSIKRNLDLNNGTLAYHLRVLEQNGFVKSMFDGIYKRYYPANINISKLKKNVSKQEEIFNIILEHPGVTMEQIGRLIGVSRQVVNYHVKNLIRAGVVDYKRDNKSARFYPLEGNVVGEQT